MALSVVLQRPSGEVALGDRVVGALRLAIDLHDGARRPGTEIPLVAHLLVVAGLVLEEGGDETVTIAALLHDAIEERGDVALERIHDEFGGDVAAMVVECSEEEWRKGRTWRERKRAHLRHITSVQDERVLLILLADKVHNVQSIVRDCRAEGEALWRRFPDRSASDQLWYFRELVGIFDHFCQGQLVIDLRRGVAELEELLSRS
jgi:(p)ppGpp synthase/HD superfamily hydrolase